MAEIVLTGLAADDPVPGEYAQINFAVGELGIGNGQYYALLIGNLLSSGAGSTNTLYGPDTAVSMTSEQDAITLFGAGSELHRQVRRFLQINQTTPLYAIAVAEGDSATAATGTITITGPATSAGTLRIFIADEFCDVGFVTGDSATTVAAAAVTQINAKDHWPVTASNASGVITITTKQKGLRANFVRYFAKIIPFSGSGVGVTPTTSTLVTGGTVSDDISAVLTTIVARRFYYIAPAAQDQTQLVALFGQINTQALPLNNIRQRMVAASVDTLANTITIVDALNGARAEMVWLQNSDMPPCEMAAHNAAVYALEESPFPPKLNFNFYGDGQNDQWRIKAPLSGTAPTRSQIKAALNAGVTPIGVRTSGRTYLVKRITTRYKNGSVVDYRIRDAHKVTVCDRYADDLQAKQAAQLRGSLLADDPKKNEPIVSGGSTNKVVTPRVVKALVDRLTDDYAEDAMLQNAADIKKGTQVQRSGVNSNRVNVSIPLQPIDVLDQIANEINQVA
ncbi:hypothetical protein [Polyangium spumosum]|uniref:Phage tail protein n=1 Tax=Polyangium spumosum TaxID=889282 RepID=A0A6N7QBH5_9BACT|nr:hypothetical protein [Polyangium spumosum]MRG98211.1 hypothetical protein [Polyangium spumosum]